MLADLIQEPFLGFSESTIKYFKSLEKNNNKIWFDKNRDKYEQYVREPMRNLIDALAPELHKIDKDFVVNYKSIFRINRDLRFSKDKTPYKCYYAAAFCFERIKKSELPHVYFHLEPGELIIAAGQYSMDPVNLKKIRFKIYNEFDKYISIIDNKDFKKLYGNVIGEKQTRLSNEFKEVENEISDKRMIEILKMKQFYVAKSYKPERAFEPAFVDLILEHAKVSRDFVKFLWEAIK